MTVIAVISSLPPCDICGLREAAYDGQTVRGPWAYMCEPCWQHHGVGKLGTGSGQKLLPHGELE
jgi:hypothetical protein